MKILISSMLILFTLTGYSQQQLEFNQVKLVTTSDTVPTDKVWKVVSVIYDVPHTIAPFSSNNTSTINCASTRNQTYSVTINGSTTKVGQGSVPAAVGSTSTGGWSQHYTILPLWLPEGAALDGGPCDNQISVIEFNIL